MKSLFLFPSALISSLLLAKGSDETCNSDDCANCVESGCAWEALGSCLETCSMASTNCYSFENYPEYTSIEICKRKDDKAACTPHRDCGSCVETLQSDGVTPCEWYINTNLGSFSFNFCDIGGEVNGFYGSTVCEEECSTIFGEPDKCSSCLDNNCGWAPAIGCMTSCDNVADASCLTAESLMQDETIQNTCDRIDIEVQNENICAVALDCSSCIETVMTDGTTMCKWYTTGHSDDGSLGGHCGTGACNMDGVCGSDSCTPVDDSDHKTCFSNRDCGSCVDTLQSDGVTPCEWYINTNLGSFSFNFCDIGGEVNGFYGSTVCEEECSTIVGEPDNCSSCLDSNCGWDPAIGCITSCDNAADTSCLTAESLMQDETKQDACDRIDTGNVPLHGSTWTARRQISFNV